ncbi:VOC family protein [Halobacillus fulvus]|nr:VOC family protein [Halobacillus fulvus]
MTTLRRVGTTYIPVSCVSRSVEWFTKYLDAELKFTDDEKAIIDLAGQSFFLVKAAENQSANFRDHQNELRFSITFEVDGRDALERLRQTLLDSKVKVGAIEDRGHPGVNFVFADPDGNLFDVWSELSPNFNKEEGWI